MNTDDTKETLKSKVEKSEIPVLVDFWAPWCGPCRRLAPTIEELAQEYEGRIKIVKVNVDREGDMAAEMVVSSVPTVIIFKNGTEVERLVGVYSFDDYADLIEKYI